MPHSATPAPAAPAAPAVQTDRRDLLIRSVGRATPALAAAVAKGLGVPMEAVARAVYRAPAVLMRELDPAVASRLADLLTATGLEVAVVEAGHTPGPVPLFDVAAHLNEPGRLAEASQALARFTGMNEAAARQLITTPPGVVLGGVSQASVDALRQALPQGVLALTVVAPEQSRYALHLLPCADAVARGLLEDLRQRGLPLLARQGLVAVDLAHATAQALWQRHSRTGALRLLHTDFLRYAVSLHGGAGPQGFDARQREALGRHAGVPEGLMDALAGALPVVLVDDVPHGELADTLARFAACGLQVQADLSSFRHYRLEVLAGPDPSAVQQALTDEGLWPAGAPLGAAAGTAPLPLPDRLSRPRARAVQARLEALGAEVSLQEVDHD